MDGLFGAPPITVIIGNEAHPSLIKSLGLLGLGRSRVIKVPVDSQGRMRTNALPTLAGPTIVCTQAGEVNSGAFDPFPEICSRVHAANGWVHVDGAFGLAPLVVGSFASGSCVPGAPTGVPGPSVRRYGVSATRLAV